MHLCIVIVGNLGVKYDPGSCQVSIMRRGGARGEESSLRASPGIPETVGGAEGWAKEQRMTYTTLICVG